MTEQAPQDERVTKRKVTMRGVTMDPGTGQPIISEVTDYVRPDLLDAYVEDARRRWGYVGVSEEPDAGPGGYDGATAVPFGVVHTVRDPSGNPVGEEFHEFPHELAGTFFPSTDGSDADQAPAHPLSGARARTITAQEG